MTNDTMRAERTYTVYMREECGGEDAIEIVVPAGTESEQDESAWESASQVVEEWVRDGDYGHEGASVKAWYYIEDDYYSWEDHERSIRVEIEPDHDYLMREAGADPDCEHEWTAEGEGGCSENPGVWAHGGTTMSFATHCRRCGLQRREVRRGNQKNPGEHDTVTYELASEEQIARWRAAGAMDEE